MVIVQFYTVLRKSELNYQYIITTMFLILYSNLFHRKKNKLK